MHWTEKMVGWALDNVCSPGIKLHYLSFLLYLLWGLLHYKAMVPHEQQVPRDHSHLAGKGLASTEVILKKQLDLSPRSPQYSPLNHIHLNWIISPEPDSGQRDMGWGGCPQPIRVHSWAGGRASGCEWDEYPNANLFLMFSEGRENGSLMAQSSKHYGLQMATPPVSFRILIYISLVTLTFLYINIPLSIFLFPLVSSLKVGSMPYSSLVPPPLT